VKGGPALVHVAQRTDTLDFLIGHWRLIRLMSDGNGPLGVFWCGGDLEMIDTEVLSESWIQERWSVHGPDTEFEPTTDLFRSINEEE
jgi:hypothetical protein